MEHLHDLPSRLRLDDTAQRELLLYHRIHARMQNSCPDCSNRSRHETKLCFWCGKFYNEEDKHTWDATDENSTEVKVATAVGPRRLPKPDVVASERIERFERDGGSLDTGTDQKAAERALKRLFGKKEEAAKGEVEDFMAKMRERGLVTDKPIERPKKRKPAGEMDG